MKSFIQFVAEMAPARASDQSKTYYHGFSHEKSLQGILAHGIQPPDLSDRSGNLRPVEGKVYITPHLEYAITYCLGANTVGHKMSDHAIENYGQFGYLCVVDGKQVHDIQPDEDDIGKFIHDDTFDWLTDMAWSELRTEEYDDTYEDEDGNEISNIKTMMRAVLDGEYDAWAAAGKLLLPVLTDDEKLELIDAGAHIAHGGELIPDEIWKFNKRLSQDLKHDGSNFFELAERIK